MCQSHLSLTDVITFRVLGDKYELNYCSEIVCVRMRERERERDIYN